MAMTLDEVKELAKVAGLKYFLHPEQPVLMVAGAGYSGILQSALVLDADGRFLQIRTVSYQRCAAGDRHLLAVLGVLGSLNYQYRFVKFGWDERDGEIVAFGDVWLLDGRMSLEQFQHLVNGFMGHVDLSYMRIQVALETGVDPGPVESDEVQGSEEGRAGAGAFLQKLRERAASRRALLGGARITAL